MDTRDERIPAPRCLRAARPPRTTAGRRAAARTSMLFLVLAGLARTAGAADKYTMEDLRALVESEGWSELLEHAEDVRPSERKAEWRSMLEKAAVGHLGILQAQDKRAEALATAEQILTRFPALKKSRPFLAKRGEVGLLAYRDCLRDSYRAADCVEQLERFIDVDPSDTDLAFEAGKLVTSYGKLWRAGPEIFARALADPKKRKARCADEDLAYSTLDSLGHPPAYDLTKAAMKVAFEYCYAELEGRLRKALYESGSMDGANLCTGFARNKTRLTPFQEAYCRDMTAKR